MVGKPVIYRWLVVAVVVAVAVFYANHLLTTSRPVQLSSLPVYGQKNADSTDHTIKNFRLTDQFGNVVTQETFKDKIYVADFIFTTCEGICPKMSDQMERVYSKYKNVNDVMFLSHSVKPEEDSIPVLKSYADEHHVMNDHWRFVTGDRKAIYDLARTAYLVGDTAGAGSPDDFVHTQYFALIDMDKRIRGFYDGTDSVDVERLLNDLAALRNGD
jgi:protein SCO1